MLFSMKLIKSDNKDVYNAIKDNLLMHEDTFVQIHIYFSDYVHYIFNIA